MYINLIPTSKKGVSYGIWTMIEAVKRFRPNLLAAVRIVQEENSRVVDEEIEFTEDQTFILLFREPASIGMMTAFINEWGTNIKASGTGGRFGKEMVECLKEHQIEPILLSKEKVFEEYPGLQLNTGDYLIKRLPYWTELIENEVITMLYSTSSGLLEKYTGGWRESWKAEGTLENSD